MKAIYTTVLSILLVGAAFGQEDPDTTRINVGGKEIIVISPGEVKVSVGDSTNTDDDHKKKDVEAHWAGLEFGPTLLLNSAMKSSFPNDPQWENDPGKSFSWNLNVLEHKFPIYKNYIGITTGLGINWTQIGLKQYELHNTDSTLYATVDSLSNFDKNKLRGIYLTAPLMVEICSHEDGDEGFYLAAGVIGGVRIGSSVKTVIDTDKVHDKEKTKGTYGLNAFRLDAAVKLGYNDWGVFANYNVLPLFDTDKTASVYPLSFGLTYNF